MIIKLFKKRKEKAKFEWEFEKKHFKSYFLSHYIRIIVLIFLVAVAVYYKSTIAICNDFGGHVVQNKSSFYKVQCEPLPEFKDIYDIYDLKYEYTNMD